jgi:hypothetical protein|tara:strand:- start:1052 stop:1225 length:174 start_codon:yes stop_codon:yes gene_type:complete
MFSLFEGRKTKTKKKIMKALDVYIPGIDGLDPEEVGIYYYHFILYYLLYDYFMLSRV